MRKIKFGSMELLGYTGMLLWMAVLLLRSRNLSDNTVYLFLLGILPNLAAAWTMTMFGKWFILFVCKQRYTVKKHYILCLGIMILALLSEWIHDVFLNSPVDFYDILITLIAQLVLLFLPMLIKDKYFEGYPSK